MPNVESINTYNHLNNLGCLLHAILNRIVPIEPNITNSKLRIDESIKANIFTLN